VPSDLNEGQLPAPFLRVTSYVRVDRGIGTRHCMLWLWIGLPRDTEHHNRMRWPAIPFDSDASPVLDDDALEHVRAVLAPVRRLFEQIEHLLPFHHGDRVLLLFE
jgi:hypothetical protein